MKLIEGGYNLKNDVNQTRFKSLRKGSTSFYDLLFSVDLLSFRDGWNIHNRTKCKDQPNLYLHGKDNQIGEILDFKFSQSVTVLRH